MVFTGPSRSAQAKNHSREAGKQILRARIAVPTHSLTYTVPVYVARWDIRTPGPQASLLGEEKKAPEKVEEE